MALLILASPLLAFCYGSNQGGFVADGFYTRKGVKGEVDFTAATPLAGRAIAHPAQIGTSSFTDFVGWGTYKGLAPAGTSCANNNASTWNIYIDGIKFGNYFCQDGYGTVANAAQDQFFRIEYTTCPGDGIAKWVFHWNSSWKTCVTINDDHGGPSAGSESAFNHTQTQNLTILYSAIRTKDTAGNWIDFGTQASCANSPYFVVIYGSRSWAIDQ